MIITHIQVEVQAVEFYGPHCKAFGRKSAAYEPESARFAILDRFWSRFTSFLYLFAPHSLPPPSPTAVEASMIDAKTIKLFRFSIKRFRFSMERGARAGNTWFVRSFE